MSKARAIFGVILLLIGCGCFGTVIEQSEFDLGGLIPWGESVSDQLLVGITTAPNDIPAMTKDHPEQAEILTLPSELWQYLSTHCAASPDGKNHEFAVIPYKTDMANESSEMRGLFSHATGPWQVLIDTGGKVIVSPLPANVPDMLTLLQKYGGK